MSSAKKQKYAALKHFVEAGSVIPENGGLCLHKGVLV